VACKTCLQISSSAFGLSRFPAFFRLCVCLTDYGTPLKFNATPQAL
jgi:hypothetical protein